MRASFLQGYKRSYYISELLALKIREIDGKPLQQLSDKELKRALAFERVKAS